MVKSRILLADNGSLAPGSTLALRSISQKAGQLIGREVRAVSMLHSGKVPPELLNGEPAVLFQQAVKEAAAEGIAELIVLPLFIGPSRAVTVSIPEQFRFEAGAKMRLRLAPALYGPDGGLRRILCGQLKAAGWTRGQGTVLLCAHGSPSRETAVVRDALAEELRCELELAPEELTACSMERRPGAEYAFNEPLLESAITKARGEAIVLMQFLLPGRHAGSAGDVAEICRRHAPAGARWKISPLIGEHEGLPALIAERFKQAVNSES